jgi:hypothetical protein
VEPVGRVCTDVADRGLVGGQPHRLGGLSHHPEQDSVGEACLAVPPRRRCGPRGIRPAGRSVQLPVRPTRSERRAAELVERDGVTRVRDAGVECDVVKLVAGGRVGQVSRGPGGRGCRGTRRCPRPR